MNDIPQSGTPSEAPASYAPQSVRFTGSGGEYFGIWIVNLLLTMLTAGIYSPWAKVRRLQYFYRHTELAGSTFDFHGSAVKILIGRILAIVLFLIYNLSGRVHPALTFLILVAAAIMMPVLLRNSFRFRLYNTSWRGTRFHFRGDVAGAYRVFLLNGFLAAITLYGLAPFMHQRLKAYQHGNSWFGRTQFSFHARVGQFYKIYLILLAGVIGFGFLFVVAGLGSTFATIARSGQGQGHGDPAAVFRAILILYGALIVVGVCIGPIFQALMTNLIWNNTRLGQHQIMCRMSALPLIWIALSNLVLVVVTLGIFIPWAAVRLRRYQLECLTILPASDLQEFQAAEPETISALGEEAATVFDFDISL